jgi:hypothetical protein
LTPLRSAQAKLGIENETDPELRELEEDVHPEDVLNEIKRVQERIGGHRKQRWATPHSQDSPSLNDANQNGDDGEDE